MSCRSSPWFDPFARQFWLAAISLPSLLCCAFLCAAETQPTTAPTTGPAIISQAGDGTILLHSRNVKIHGTTVRYEPNPHKNTVGYWTRKEDWVSWDFAVSTAGKFDVVILQGCGTGSGGSEVEFAVGDQKIKMTVQDTGGFQNFVERNIGSIDLSAGPQTLSVIPITKPGLAVMDLRQVELYPLRK